jgi:hypothetical protein
VLESAWTCVHGCDIPINVLLLPFAFHGLVIKPDYNCLVYKLWYIGRIQRQDRSQNLRPKADPGFVRCHHNYVININDISYCRRQMLLRYSRISVSTRVVTCSMFPANLERIRPEISKGTNTRVVNTRVVLEREKYVANTTCGDSSMFPAHLGRFRPKIS